MSEHTHVLRCPCCIVIFAVLMVLDGDENRCDDDNDVDDFLIRMLMMMVRNMVPIQ